MIISADDLNGQVAGTAQALRDEIGGAGPRLALVLGSGLSRLAEDMEIDTVVSYADLPHFPQPSVEGHAGRLIFGTLSGVPLVCMEGRMHAYEGHEPQALAVPVRVLRAIGVEILILTNAAGSLREDMPPGSLMIIRDHINFSGVNPLIGPNDDTVGPRFLDLTNAYDRDLRAALRDAGRDAGIDAHEGVYIMYSGPNFETPAEIRAFQTLGADAVGMSTVPECLIANHCGMKVAGVSTITNLAAGLSGHALSHEETLARGAAAYESISALIKGAVIRMGK